MQEVPKTFDDSILEHSLTVTQAQESLNSVIVWIFVDINCIEGLEWNGNRFVGFSPPPHKSFALIMQTITRHWYNM